VLLDQESDQGFFAIRVCGTRDQARDRAVRFRRNAPLDPGQVTDARGRGVAESLIAACRDASRAHGATTLSWQTALDNTRAQAVYERVGATRDEWVDYSLDVSRAPS